MDMTKLKPADCPFCRKAVPSTASVCQGCGARWMSDWEASGIGGPGTKIGIFAYGLFFGLPGLLAAIGGLFKPDLVALFGGLALAGLPLWLAQKIYKNKTQRFAWRMK